MGAKWELRSLDFHTQTDKPMMANQPDTEVVDKLQRKALVIDIAVQTSRRRNTKSLQNTKGERKKWRKWSWELSGPLPPNWESGSNRSQDQYQRCSSRMVQSKEQLRNYEENSSSQASGRQPELE